MNICKSWNEVTLKQMDGISHLKDIEDEEEKGISLIYLLLKDKQKLSLGDYIKLAGEISFITQPIPKSLPREEITLNGIKYKVYLDIQEYIAAQYIDYAVLLRGDSNIHELLSCFILPVGVKYSDNYDVEAVRQDIYNYLNIVDATAIFNVIKDNIINIHNSYPNIFSTVDVDEIDIDSMQTMNNSFMGKYWYIVMGKKVADFYNLPFDKATELSLIEFLNIYSYVLDKEKLDADIQKEEMRRIKARSNKR